MATGIIKRYDFRKGFGFIADDKSGDDFFFHKSEWQGDGPIRQGLAVKFNGSESDKGPQAEAVVPVDGVKKAVNTSAKPKKPASADDRLSALESSLATLKVVSFIALAGVIALAIYTFVL